jgi:hypothetical protein
MEEDRAGAEALAAGDKAAAGRRARRKDKGESCIFFLQDERRLEQDDDAHREQISTVGKKFWDIFHFFRFLIF